MKYTGKDPNGLNQISQSLLSLDVNGESQVNISTDSVSINTELSVENGISAISYTGSVFSGSDVVTSTITADSIIVDTIDGITITGTEFSGSFSGSFQGDGNAITNIPTSALVGDINRIAEGDANATITEDKFSVNVDTDITGSLLVTNTVSASFIKGDGSGLTNISADSVGDINRIQSGSAIARISPNEGLVTNVGIVTEKYLGVTGSAKIGENLDVDGTITTQTLDVDYRVRLMLLLMEMIMMMGRDRKTTFWCRSKDIVTSLRVAQM